MSRAFLISVLIVGMAAAGSAATITVNSAGGADHTTIGAAISAANVAGGDEVVVTNSGATYDETVTIDRPVILRGADPGNPPVIATQSRTGSAFGDGDGLYIDTDGAVTLQDLVLIPSMDAGMTDDLIMAVPGGTTSLDVTMTNVLVTGNDGSGNPVVAFNVDDFTVIDTAAAGSKFCNDCIYMFAASALGIGRDGTLNLDMNNVRVLGVGADDGMVLYSGTNGSISMSDVVVTYAPDDGIQFGTILANSAQGTLDITGTRSDPGVTLWRTGDGISMFEAGVVTIDHLVALETAGGVTQAGFLIFMDAVTSASVADSLFANNFIGMSIQDIPPAPTTLTVTDTTFFTNGISVDLGGATTADLTVTFTDNIFAGTGTGVNNNNGGAATTAFDFNVFASSGADALTLAVDGTINSTNQLGVAPIFFNSTAPPLTGDEFDVQNPALQGASSTSGDLTGWGILNVPPAAQDWMQFE